MAYSNTRYTRYRHSPKLITPIQPIPKTQDIEAIQTKSIIQPIYPYQGLDEKRRIYLRAQQDKQTQTFLANYNDPTELNSYIDALTNREAVSKKFGETWGTISTTSGFVSVLSFAGSIIAAALAPFTGGASLAVAAPLAKVGAIAAIPSIPAAVDVTIEKGIKPIIAGKPKEALLNTLMNLGETVDFAANPVKGLIMEGGEGFIKGLGVGSEGRVNYDYDTGFFLTDMLLETVTDPMNWITFGTSTALKSATKTVGRTVTDELINNTVSVVNKQLAKSIGEITTEGAERISKQVSKTIAQVSRDWAGASFKNLTKEAQEAVLKNGRNKIQRSLVNALKKELPDATSNQLDIILKKAGRSVSTGQFTKSTINQISDITFDSLSTNVIKNLAGIQHYAEGFEKFMTKGAMLTSGYGLGVEAAKTGWKGIKAWQNNYTLKTLKKAQVFDSANGLDIKQWDKAKNLWEASYNYTTALTGEKAQRDMNSFYVFAAQQFNRDKQLIAKILQDNPTALAKSAALDAQFKALYGCEFREYISILKNIDSKESGMFKQFIDYAEATEKALPDQAISKPLGLSMKTGKQLYSAQNTESIAKLQNNLIEQVQKAIKISKDKIELTDRLYTIKMNNAYVNAMLVNNPVIAETLMDIQSSKHIGALLDKIKGDINALGNSVPAHIPVAVRTIKDAGASFTNIKTLYDNVGMLPLPNINKINIDDFKRYILDQIFGENKSVSELLAEFDSITMPSLMNSLEVMLYEYDFKFADYPTLKEQIASVYKQFLEEQQRAGIEMVGATIVEDFTKSVDDLVRYMPQYADDLQELSRANLEIRASLAQVKNANLEILESVFTNKKTIFEVANTRQLADAGLALKVVAIKENLNLFNIPEGISGNVVEAANRLGKSINHLKQSLQQYRVHFGKRASEEISKAYKEFRKQFLDNPDFELAGFPAFKYLKDTDDTIEQFTQLIEFNRASKDAATSEQFKDILRKHLGTNVYLNVMDPSGLMVTDFAWDAMAQSAWVAKTRFNERIINSITAYRNLSLLSKKATNDFQVIRDLLSTNKLDRPKMLMQERYIKAATKINNTLEYFEQCYNNLFNKQLAKETLEAMDLVFLENPDLAKRYKDLNIKLRQYWDGELQFKQSLKGPETNMAAQLHKIIADKNRIIREAHTIKFDADFQADLQNRIQQAQKAITEATQKLKRLQEQGFDDEFTPFWWELKEFNKDYAIIQQKTITQDAIKNILSKKLYTEWFVDDSTKGTRLLDILTDYNLTELTKDDFRLYSTFLTEATPFLDPSDNIPYNLIPASIRQTTLKYYYDVLGIDNPNLVYDYSLNIGEKILGRFTQGVNAINAAVQTNPVMIDALHYDFNRMLSTLRHESGHNVLYRVLNETEYEQFMRNFKKRFIELYGEQAYNNAKLSLKKRYGEGANINAPNFNKRIEEEIFAFTLENGLSSLDFELNQYGIPNKFKELDTSAFSEELMEQLKQYVSSKRDPILTELRESFEQYTAKHSVELPHDTLKFITPWDPIRKQQELNKLINRATEQNAKGAFYNLFNLTPEQFKTELAYRKRFITFKEEDVADYQLNAMFNKFNYGNKKMFSTELVDVYQSANGWYSVHDKAKHRYWYVLDKSQEVTMSGRQVYLNGNILTRLQNKHQFNEFELVDKFINDPNNPGVTKTLNELDDILETLTGSRLGDSQGEYFSKEMLEKMYEQMPEEVQNLLPDIAEMTNKQFFDSYVFNESVLGSMHSKAELGIYASNMITNTSNAITQAQGYLKPKTEYVNTVFDSAFSISGPNSIYSNFTDQGLLDALQANPDYKLVALVEDKKYGVKVREILPTSLEAIRKGKELGAVVVPLQTYKDMYNVVNHRLGSTGMAKLWNRIMYTYKFGYLCRPGAWIRNWFDTNIKTSLKLGDDFITYKAQATKLINERDHIHKLLKSRDPQGIIRMKDVEQYFIDNPDSILNWKLYQELEEDFFSQGVSGNVMRQVIGEDAWATFTEMTGNILDLPNKTEEYNRLAMYLFELDRGADTTSALARLSKTHFDYSFKTQAEQLVEMVFPFTTFSLRNYSYWIEMLEKHPWIMRNYVHLMKPHWDFKDYTPEELARDYRVQTQILYGQLKLAEFEDKVITFKANPSIQDAIQMFTDPINNVYEKLAAPISVPLKLMQKEYTQPTNLIPVIGPIIQSIDTMAKTGTPLPSAIGVSKAPKRTGQKPTKQYVKFRNKNLSKVNKFRDKYYHRPRYTKNVIYDSYSLKGIDRYRANLYPVIDIAHEVRSRYSVNVYNRIKNRVQTDVYQGIRYRLRLDANRFR